MFYKVNLAVKEASDEPDRKQTEGTTDTMKRRNDRDEDVEPIARQIEQLARALQTPPGRHGLLIGENSWLSKCCFHLTLIFLTLIFVGFRPSKIH